MLRRNLLIIIISLFFSCDNIDRFSIYQLKTIDSINSSDFSTADYTYVFKTIYKTKDKIYIGNTGGKRVDIFDISSEKFTGKIDTWTFNDKTESLQDISDIAVAAGKIYIASKNSGHRVDVFDESTLQFISCLGTGGYSGNQGGGDNTIWNPTSVRATDKFVFVKERRATVAVFAVEDIKAENYKKTPVFTHLKIENYNSSNDILHIELYKNYLFYADKISNSIKYFDISKIVKTGNKIEDGLEPTFELKLGNFMPNSFGFTKDNNLIIYGRESNKNCLKVVTEKLFPLSTNDIVMSTMIGSNITMNKLVSFNGIFYVIKDSNIEQKEVIITKIKKYGVK